MTWMVLTSGRGPVECEYAVAKLVTRVCVEALTHHLVPTLLECSESQHGMYSALLSVEGADADAFVAAWSGTIQWIAASPLRKTKRKNWFVGARAISEPPADIALEQADLRFDTMRASGPGGQHVNVTESAVRVTHLPTGTTAYAQEERSQYRNRSLALARLAEALEKESRDAKQDFERDKWSSHNSVERGRPVRIFVGDDFRDRKRV